MPEDTCPVSDLIDKLASAIDSGRLTNPRDIHRAEDVLRLLRDVALGGADKQHVPAMQSLAAKLALAGKTESATQIGNLIESSLNQHDEIFTSHIDTHNCATGDCVKLAPAPCQMTCPAGLDIPTYVTLIGLGRDA